MSDFEEMRDALVRAIVFNVNFDNWAAEFERLPVTFIETVDGGVI